jgi:Protein of unknown function (DUF2497)
MSELPANIDAILASIRSRMNEDGSMPPIETPPPPEAAPPLPVAVADVGKVEFTGSSTTLESVVQAMLEPLLKAWLDANMPEIVEKLAQAEIKRLTGRD